MPSTALTPPKCRLQVREFQQRAGRRRPAPAGRRPGAPAAAARPARPGTAAARTWAQKPIRPFGQAHHHREQHQGEDGLAPVLGVLDQQAARRPADPWRRSAPGPGTGRTGRAAQAADAGGQRGGEGRRRRRSGTAGGWTAGWAAARSMQAPTKAPQRLLRPPSTTPEQQDHHQVVVEDLRLQVLEVEGVEAARQAAQAGAQGESRPPCGGRCQRPWRRWRSGCRAAPRRPVPSGRTAGCAWPARPGPAAPGRASRSPGLDERRPNSGGRVRLQALGAAGEAFQFVQGDDA